MGMCLPGYVYQLKVQPPQAHLINFGDSNSDTGGLLAGTGLPIGLPHGITFFHRGTGRLGDGQFVIDFFCEFKFSIHLKFCRSLFFPFFYLAEVW